MNKADSRQLLSQPTTHVYLAICQLLSQSTINQQLTSCISLLSQPTTCLFPFQLATNN